MKATSERLKSLGINRPTLVLDEAQAARNIGRMVARAAGAQVELRPHFKTHQSAQVGELFRQAGVRAITVSSMRMAAYFATHGWDDITVAIPLNPGEIGLINQLAAEVKLNLLVDSPAAVAALAAALQHNVDVWVEIDSGYGRTGVPYDRPDQTRKIARQIEKARHCRFAGLLAHDGQTYTARSAAEVTARHKVALGHIRSVAAYLLEQGLERCDISIGDTPSASVMDAFPGVAELRPGNFAFYDLMQAQIGVCRSEEIAVAVACPVIGIYRERGQVVIHGGAVHFSKDRLEVDGQSVYGYPTTLQGDSFGPAMSETPLVSVSQEHGILNAPGSLLDEIGLGDLLLVLPVHSCLTVNLFANYLTLTGERWSLMPKE